MAVAVEMGPEPLPVAPQVAVLPGAGAQLQLAVPLVPFKVWEMVAPVASTGPLLVTVTV